MLAVLVLAVLFTGLTPAGSAMALDGPCPNGANGPIGYTLTLTPTGTTAVVSTARRITAAVRDGQGGAVADFCLNFTQNAGPSTGWPRHAFTLKDGNASIDWTSSAVGTDSITASYTDDRGQRIAATIRHTWTAKPAPPPAPSPTASPTPPPKTASPTPSATTSPTPKPTASPTPSPTPSATPAPSPTASPTPPPVPVLSGLPDGSLQLDRPSALPGGSATLQGRNCPANSEVTYTVEGAAAGTSTASSDGSFSGEVQLPDATLGQHLIEVTCGGQTASVPIDLVVSSSTSTPGATATAVAILVFFVLLGSILFARSNPQRKLAEPSETDTDE